jgi:hypothetical protein
MKIRTSQKQTSWKNPQLHTKKSCRTTLKGYWHKHKNMPKKCEVKQ